MRPLPLNTLLTCKCSWKRMGSFCAIFSLVYQCSKSSNIPPFSLPRLLLQTSSNQPRTTATAHQQNTSKVGPLPAQNQTAHWAFRATKKRNKLGMRKTGGVIRCALFRIAEKMSGEFVKSAKEACPRASLRFFHADFERWGLRNVRLRSYQLDGVCWLAERHSTGHGCILGDEMGLGKTLQVF